MIGAELVRYGLRRLRGSLEADADTRAGGRERDGNRLPDP